MAHLNKAIPYHDEVASSASEQNASMADRIRGVRGLDSLVQAFESLATISATDIKGTIIFANEEFSRISGYSHDELVGQSHRIVASGYHPAAFFKEMWRTIAGGKVWQGEVKNRAKDGSFYWVNTVIVPFRDNRGKIEGYISAHIDITKQKLAEEQVLVQNLQLETALNNMARGLSMFDAEARLITCNELYRQLYDLPEELTRPGTPIAEIVRFHRKRETGRDSKEDVASERKWIENHLAKLARGISLSDTQHLQCGRTVLITTQPLPNGGWVDLQEDVTEKERLEAKIAHMALHDALTDLPNRVLLDERLALELARVRRGEKLALHLLDLDQFKAVNDTLGHPIGDELLTAVAGRLRGTLRDVDMIARMGGDEFVVVQVGIGAQEDVVGFARRLIDAVSEPFDIEGHQIMVGMSIGIALAPTDGDTADQLIRNADLALYRAKEQGRRTYCFFEKELNERVRVRQALMADLHKALAAGQIELHYQPIVDLEQYQMTGVEALMRWHHPERGLIPPCEFIPMAEESGLIVPLGDWAIRQACAQVAAWPDRIKVALNLSPVQLKRPGLVQTVLGALAASGLPADRLELEVTETVLLEETDTTLAILHQLRGAGVRIVMDDFGTGYSSLNYLSKFPFDKIKIDHTFINKITVNVVALKIVRAIVQLARSLGMTTTAEGVETKEQLDAVRFEGCDEIQGYFICRPQLAQDIERRYLPRSGVHRKLVDDDTIRISAARHAI
jgi:diguanylate cyclase (GGDEF)-like protein/PAS domain S-box-containing protein